MLCCGLQQRKQQSLAQTVRLNRGSGMIPLSGNLSLFSLWTNCLRLQEDRLRMKTSKSQHVAAELIFRKTAFWNQVQRNSAKITVWNSICDELPVTGSCDKKAVAGYAYGITRKVMWWQQSALTLKYHGFVDVSSSFSLFQCQEFAFK